MKLITEKKWFDLAGENKTFEVRDAHLTLVCKETCQTKRFKIMNVSLSNRKRTFRLMKQIFGCKKSELEKLFEDDFQVVFAFGPEIKTVIRPRGRSRASGRITDKVNK